MVYDRVFQTDFDKVYIGSYTMYSKIYSKGHSIG